VLADLRAARHLRRDNDPAHRWLREVLNAAAHAQRERR